MPRAILLLLALLVLSCGEKHRAGKATAQLVKRPEIAPLVDALAVEKTIESSHVGAGGEPSRVYEKFRAIQAKATSDELTALLEHESPVVRGYAGQHLARSGPAPREALATLAGDGTPVETLNGCIGGGSTVGAVVREALCYSKLPEAGAVLLAIHDQGGKGAAEALACAAPTAPGTAGDSAMRALRRRGLTESAEAAYLRVLAISAPDGGCEFARPRAHSSDASVQIGAAQALWRCDDAASQEALKELSAGKNVVVARHAKASIFLVSQGRRDDLGRDHEVRDEANDRLAKALQSPEGAKKTIALAETLALAYPEYLGAPFHSAAESAETTAVARRLAAKIEPLKERSWGSVRAGVIAYLGRILDRESLPELRRSLLSEDTNEILSALQALTSLHDTEARPAIEKLTTHRDADVAKAAKQALSAR